MLYKEITYKNHIYKIAYTNKLCKDSIGTIKHLLILIRVDYKTVTNLEYEWSDTCGNRNNIITEVYNLIERYIFIKNKVETVAESTKPIPIVMEAEEILHINEFEKWKGNLDEINISL